MQYEAHEYKGQILWTRTALASAKEAVMVAEAAGIDDAGWVSDYSVILSHTTDMHLNVNSAEVKLVYGSKAIIVTAKRSIFGWKARISDAV